MKSSNVMFYLYLDLPGIREYLNAMNYSIEPFFYRDRQKRLL